MVWVAPGMVQAQTTDETAPQNESTHIAAFDRFNPEHVEQKVRTYFADIPVMVAIAKCESGFRQYDSFGNTLYGGTGGMAGVFQVAAAIHNDTARELGIDINTLEGNLAYARHLYENQGFVPWFASAHCWSPIKTSLQVGSTGAQVMALQRILNTNGFTVATEGPGSLGQESTTFGPATRDAVRRFQCTMGIVCKGNEQSTGYGMVGAKTRLSLLKLDMRMAVSSSTNLSLLTDVR